MWSVSTDPGPPVFLARSLLSHQRSPEAPRSSKREVTAGAVSASSTAVGASTSHSAGSRASGPLTSARTCPHLHLPTLAYTCPHPLTPAHTHTCTCTQSTDRERLHYTHGHVCSGLWVFVSFLHTSCVGWMPVTVIHHYSRTITKIPEGCLTAPSPVETEDSGRSQELPVRTDAQSATWQPVHTIGSSSGAQSCVRGQHRLHGVRRAPT